MQKIAILFSLFLLASCYQSGDGLAKKLTMKGGTWSITKIVWQIVEQDITSQNIYSGEEVGGILSFEDSGNMTYDYKINGLARNGNALWSVNDKEVQITYIDLAGLPAGPSTIEYTVVHDGLHKIKLQGTEAYIDSAQRSITNTMSIELERRY